MKEQFVPVCEVRLKHSYYANGYCQGLALQLTPAAAKTLRTLRWVWQPRPAGGLIMRPKGDLYESGWLAPDANDQLRLTVVVEDNAFHNITSTDGWPSSGRKLWRNTSESSGSLALEGEALPRGTNTAGQLGQLCLEKLPQLVAAASPALYTVDFNARTDAWKYYLILPKNGAVTEYSIVDEDAGRAGSPIQFNSAQDLATPPEDDPVAQDLAAQYPNKARVLISSNQPLAYQQVGRQGIALMKGSAVLVEHLPNPAATKHGITIVKRN